MEPTGQKLQLARHDEGDHRLGNERALLAAVGCQARAFRAPERNRSANTDKPEATCSLKENLQQRHLSRGRDFMVSSIFQQPSENAQARQGCPGRAERSHKRGFGRGNATAIQGSHILRPLQDREARRQRHRGRTTEHETRNRTSPNTTKRTGKKPQNKKRRAASQQNLSQP